MNRWRFVSIAAGIMLCLGCQREEKSPHPPARPPAPVVTASAVQKEISVSIRAIGRVEAVDTVSIRPKVEGEITKIHFQEGQPVREGDLLFSIDRRAYELSLNQARAKVNKEEALLKELDGDAQRKKAMLSKDFISQQQYDKAVSQADSQKATLAVTRADVEIAELKLNYCAIRSPVTGRTGKILISFGNFVSPSGSPLVEIKRMQPAYVSFTVPGKHVSAVRAHMKEHDLKVVVALSGTGKQTVTGKLTFLDNEVDKATGTILLKGIFENADGTLWAGQFVDADLNLATVPDAVVVPTRAVQKGPEGFVTFVMKPDNTVEVRPVTPGLSMEEETEIKAGLRAGERVVIDGQLALYPGAPVVEKPPAGAAEKSRKENTGK